MIRRRLFVAVASLLLTFTFGAIAAPAVPAAAKTAPAVNFVLSGNCDSGGGRMLCYVYNPGRPEPYDIKWYINKQYRSVYDDEGAINFYCASMGMVYVQVFLTDNTGAWDEWWTYCRCNPGPWD